MPRGRQKDLNLRNAASHCALPDIPARPLRPLEYDAIWQDRQDSNPDTRFWRPLLYHLSYVPVWWSALESNQDVPGYEPGALTI